MAGREKQRKPGVLMGAVPVPRSMWGIKIESRNTFPFPVQGRGWGLETGSGIGRDLRHQDSSACFGIATRVRNEKARSSFGFRLDLRLPFRR